MHAVRVVGAAFLGVALAGGAVVARTAQKPAAPKPAAGKPAAKPGVFSTAQATRGEGLYKKQCASCHAPDLTGGDAPALAGADFLGFWDKAPVSDLVGKIQESMPQGSPGSLSAQQATDITAYVLKINKVPAGAVERPSNAAKQKAIKISK